MTTLIDVIERINHNRASVRITLHTKAHSAKTTIDLHEEDGHKATALLDTDHAHALILALCMHTGLTPPPETLIV